jgi:phosphoserine aminotransferase
MTPSIEMPAIRPANPCFSSGPCAKRPGWTPEALNSALLGRSHRSAAGKARLKALIERTGALLGVPEGWRIAVVPASDTGAVEMALWSLLGPRGVDLLVWESFGAGWASDVIKQLKLDDVRNFEAAYGELPDLDAVDFARDVVFVWNGTTSGVAVPGGDWIAADREGLTICDATSAAFAMALPWAALDVVTFSWQKALGGEAGLGMLVLGPRAVERLENYAPPWPLPKIFRLTKGGRLNEEIFAGATINTPSMLCVEDALDALAWAESIGGLEALMARSRTNLDAIEAWVARTGWIEFLAADPAVRSCTSVCLRFADPVIAARPVEDQAALAKAMAKRLEAEGVAFDIGAYRDAPPGLRLWAGATVAVADLDALFPWLDWAWAQARAG